MKGPTWPIVGYSPSFLPFIQWVSQSICRQVTKLTIRQVNLLSFRIRIILNDINKISQMYTHYPAPSSGDGDNDLLPQTEMPATEYVPEHLPFCFQPLNLYFYQIHPNNHASFLGLQVIDFIVGFPNKILNRNFICSLVYCSETHASSSFASSFHCCFF